MTAEKLFSNNITGESCQLLTNRDTSGSGTNKVVQWTAKSFYLLKTKENCHQLTEENGLGIGRNRPIKRQSQYTIT